MPLKLLLLSSLTMSITRTVPKAKTIALGGVATGNMKAKDVVIAVGNMKNSGLTPRVRA